MKRTLIASGIIAILSLSAVAASAAVSSTCLSAGGVAVGAKPATLAQYIAVGDCLIQKRDTDLSSGVNRLASIVKLSATDKTTLQNNLEDTITTLAGIKAHLDADTSATTAATDYHSIFGSVRVYLLVLPRTWIVAAADRMETIAGELSSISSALTTRANALPAGSQKDQALALIVSLNTDISTANSDGANAISSVMPLQPDQGDQSIATSNHTTLVNARGQVKAGTAALKDAIQRIAGIRAAIKGNTSLYASCTGSPYTDGSFGASWSASALGGAGSYTYQWSMSDGATITGGTAQSSSLTASYGTAGLKHASVSVSDGSKNMTVNCTATVGGTNSSGTFSVPGSVTLSVGQTRTQTNTNFTITLNQIEVAQTATIGSSPVATAADITLAGGNCIGASCTNVIITPLKTTLSQGQSATLSGRTVTLTSLTTTSATFSVTTGTSPSAYLTANVSSGAAPLSVIFTVSGPISSYAIDFGDGTKGAGTASDTNCAKQVACTIQHTYSTAGTYTASLTSGGTGSVTITVNASNTSGNLSADVTSGTSPLAVTFTVTGSVSTYGIDFGDGTRGGGGVSDSNCAKVACTIKHTYSSGGTYMAKLTSGGTGSVTITVKNAAATGEYIGYQNGKQFIKTEDITKADALSNCKQNANSNAGVAIRCTWNGNQIFNNTPPSLSASPNIGHGSLTVTFTVKGDVSSYAISPGDGTGAISGSAANTDCSDSTCTVKHTYASPSAATTYTAKLKDANGTVLDSVTIQQY